MSHKQWMRSTLVLALMLWFASASAMQVLADEFYANARRATAHPLPPVTDWTRVAPPGRAVPMLLIGDFNEGVVGCEARALGEVTGTALRTYAWGMTDSIALIEPSHVDGDVDGDGETGIVEREAGAYGARWFMRGMIERTDSALALEAELVDRRQGQTLWRHRGTTTEAELGSALATVIGGALAAIDRNPPAAGTARAASLKSTPAGLWPELLAARKKACSDSQGDRVNDLPAVIARYPESPIAPVLLAQALCDRSSIARVAGLDRIATRDPAVAIAYLAHGAGCTDAGLANVEMASQLAARFPTQPAALIALSLTHYAANPGMRSGPRRGGPPDLTASPSSHDPAAAAAMAAALAALRMAPENVRAWQVVAESLDFYAGRMRGDKRWSEMGADGPRYNTLLELSREAANSGLRVAPRRGSLWRLRMTIAARLNEDWWPDFLRGVEATPHNPRLYSSAMHYAQRQWGGTAERRAEIFRISRRNNPDADWPKELYRGYAPASEFVWHAYRGWWFLLIAASCSWLAWAWWKSRSAE
jgi:hypothetical protein